MSTARPGSHGARHEDDFEPSEGVACAASRSLTALASSPSPAGHPRAQTVLVDDHPLFRLGLQAVLRREPDVEVVGDLPNATDVLKLATQTRFDVAVVDLIMPDVDGIALTVALHRVQPQWQDPRPVGDRRAGADRGDAPRGSLGVRPEDAARGRDHRGDATVLGGVRYLAPAIARDEIDALTREDHQPFSRLTLREREVLERLIRGASNAAIGTALAISRRTVETHRQRIMKKLEVHTIVELLAVAARHGLIGN